MYCPCASGKDLDDCCGRFISHHHHAENAQQLMRSRYSAYVLNKADYILATWHPRFRPLDIRLDKNLKWLQLTIMNVSQRDTEATVEFEARLLKDKCVNALHELSDFICEQGRWFYTEGQMLPPTFKPWRPARNETCPCGSGLKFKRCCESRGS